MRTPNSSPQSSGRPGGWARDLRGATLFLTYPHRSASLACRFGIIGAVRSARQASRSPCLGAFTPYRRFIRASRSRSTFSSISHSCHAVDAPLKDCPMRVFFSFSRSTVISFLVKAIGAARSTHAPVSSPTGASSPPGAPRPPRGRQPGSAGARRRAGRESGPSREPA